MKPCKRRPSEGGPSRTPSSDTGPDSTGRERLRWWEVEVQAFDQVTLEAYEREKRRIMSAGWNEDAASYRAHQFIKGRTDDGKTDRADGGEAGHEGDR